MRVLLRNLDTGAYYAGDGRWVRAESQAYDFVEVETANQLRSEPGLGRVELVLAFNIPGLRSRFTGSGRDHRGGQPARPGVGRPGRREEHPHCPGVRNFTRKAGRRNTGLYGGQDPRHY